MLSDMKYLSAINVTPIEHQVYINGNIAISMFRSKNTGEYKGKNVDYQSMESIVLEKQNARWKIIRVHCVSFP
jgi:ketosteroid isomerase-like protein